MVWRRRIGADRVGDVAGREAGRRDLVEERLEEVMVAAVDDRQAHGRLAELARRGQPAETGADDDDVRRAVERTMARRLYLPEQAKEKGLRGRKMSIPSSAPLWWNNG